MTYQQLLLPFCCSEWLLHVFYHTQRYGMLVLMTLPIRRDVETYYRETNSHFYIPFSCGGETYSFYIPRQYQCVSSLSYSWNIDMLFSFIFYHNKSNNFDGMWPVGSILLLDKMIILSTDLFFNAYVPFKFLTLDFLLEIYLIKYLKKNKKNSWDCIVSTKILNLLLHCRTSTDWHVSILSIA